MELPIPTASELLAIWEQCLGRQPFQQALALLSTVSPGASVNELARLTIGQRDERLIMLHAQMFGPKIASVATCPGCGARLEIAFDTQEILASGMNSVTLLDTRAELSVSVDGYQITFRLPDSLDLLDISGMQDVSAARNRLLKRCLLEIRYVDQAQTLDNLPEAVMEVVESQMEQLDPYANISVLLSCPACSIQWEAKLDIVMYFLEEMNAWATRLLREVHTLASAYGWREADILALSPRRREFYLEMVRG
jgi:hypothetical protein